MNRILLIEDALDQQMIVKSIIGETHELTVAATAQSGLEALRSGKYTLILLDVSLPDTDGFSFCAELKRDPALKEIPVIFLTGKQDPKDKILGFSLGADDYVVKPFEPLEFKARVESKIRKFNENKQLDDSFNAGKFRLTAKHGKAFMQDADRERDLGLTSIEFKLFDYLARNEGIFKNADQIIDNVWGRDKIQPIDTATIEISQDVWGDTRVVNSYEVDAQIASLRAKIGALGTCIVHNPILGYKFSSGA